MQKYKQLKRDIVWALSYYANVYTNVIDSASADEKIKAEYADDREKLRKLSCDIRSFVETLSWFRLGIPSKKRLIDASDELMGLSNSLTSPYGTVPTTAQCAQNRQVAERIYSALGVYSKKKKLKQTKKMK